MRADGLDGLRGLAAAAVVLLHVWMFSGAHDARYTGIVDDAIGSLGLSLMLFFVLSGYLVSAPWIRAARRHGPPPSLRRYSVRRAARILPAYWLCLGGSYLLMRQLGHPHAINAELLPVFALFAQNQVDATAGMLNPPLWSLGVEVAFYVAMPLLGLAMIATLRRHGRHGALVLSGVIAAAGLAWTAVVHHAGGDPRLIASLPTFLPVFACGIAAAALHPVGTAWSRPARAALLAGGALLVILDGWWHAGSTGTLGHVVRNLPSGIGFAMIVLAVAQGPARVLGRRPLVTAGLWSYGVYLWHMPVLYTVQHAGWWPQSPWSAYGLVLGVSTVLGAASWLLVEQPATRAIGARLAARRQPSRPPSATSPPPSKKPAAAAAPANGTGLRRT